MDKYPLCEFKLKGIKFQAFTAPDDTGSCPWGCDDRRGPVRWVRSARDEKRPGERVLWQDRNGARLYDFAAAVKLARKDGWDAPPYKTGTKGEQAARAAEADFQFMRRFCRGDWCYVGVTVEGAGERESVWGIESEAEAEDYLKETARDLAAEILHQVAEKRRKAEVAHCFVGSAPCAP